MTETATEGGQRHTLDWTAQQQSLASDPSRSAWVSANAGSGKTHVLSQRVIRLLLNGCRPSAILCLTYTKAAASEMSNRVFNRLSEWTSLDDTALSRQITELDGRRPDQRKLTEARRLFARALETPGGLKIQTIHAFCESVLHQFPLEANVAGHFEVMDDVASETLFRSAREALLQSVARGTDKTLSDAFDKVLNAGSEAGLEALLNEALAKRQPIRRFLNTARVRGGVEAVLRKAAGLAETETAESICQTAWPPPSPSSLETYCAAALTQSAKTPKNWAEIFKTATGMSDPIARFDFLKKSFLRQDGQPRSMKNAVTRSMAQELPDLESWIHDVAESIFRAHDRMQILTMISQTCAALELIRHLDQSYESLKRARGYLDFDDLVTRTARLLEQDGAGPWVHYKLDRGIDHILVDEAQDTSPDQWAVIESLAAEFFAGETARDTRRTLFAVGDEKQSIYSFQGARPELFMQTGRSMRLKARDAQLRFDPISLHLSFRSTADVLSAVDAVFARPENAKGLQSADDAITHSAFRAREPGQVELWDMIGRQAAADDEDWKAPFDETPESAPAAILARRIAATIKKWLERGEGLARDGGKKPVTAGDILILVRKRDGFVSALMRQLKRAGIPVAGADRLKLTSHIAVEDLMALGRFVLMPGDDLSLSAVLKSPLFGFSEEELYRLAGERDPAASVYDHLQELAAKEGGKWDLASATLQNWLSRADWAPVHEFYAHILGRDRGRAKFLARLGSEAGDILDEFLAFALERERGGMPGLEGFLATLDQQSPEIKRELQQGRDEIRIMTVHAAKGLEAPIVFLVDSGGKPAESSHLPNLQELSLEKTLGPVPPAVLWASGKSSDNSMIRSLRGQLLESGEDEYRRLFYVGMTRAADRLIVCGYHGLREPTHRHWHKMAAEALGESADSNAVEFAVGDEQWSGLRYSTSAPDDSDPEQTPSQSESLSAKLPEALKQPLANPKQPPRPLVPSSAGLVIDPASSDASLNQPLFSGESGPSQALERGRMTHRVLQLLPDIAQSERQSWVSNYVNLALPEWTQQERVKLAESVLSIVTDEAFAPVFARGSRAEVSVVGTVTIAGEERAISARLDRIAVATDRVLIADYKTNRTAPTSLSQIPAVHITQMALYRALLQPLYPDKPVEAALLYTETPVLIQLTDERLNAAMDELTNM